MIICAFCNNEIELYGKISHNDTCPHCGWDLHCCMQCKFYDTSSYNQCKETMAERVIEKEKSNFCEYFLFKDAADSGINGAAKAKKALEELFMKK